MSTLLIKNGTVVRPGEETAQLDILVEDGVVREIGANISAEVHETVDATGKTVTPGIVDMHVHLREPGREDKETIRTATLSAAKGGVTSMLAMPNTNPPIDDQSKVTFVLEKAKAEGVVRVFTTGNMTRGGEGTEMAEMWEMKNNGVKVINDDAVKRANPQLFYKILEYCRVHDLTIMSHVQLDEAAEVGVMNEGWMSTQLGLPGSPASWEASQVAATLDMLREKPLPFHFTQVTCARSVELIRQAKAEGLLVTADTMPHYLVLTDEACAHYNTQAKVWPPLRGEADRAALRAGIADGTIDCLASDHAPHILVEKFVEFDKAAFGITGLETFWPVLYTELVKKDKVISLERLVEMTTRNPARVMREDIGELAVGAPADITVWDLNTTRTIDKETFVSKARNTIWDGHEVQATPVETVVAGRRVVKDGELTQS